MRKVYQCTCGLWSRKELKFLTDEKAICHCGNEMHLSEKDIQPVKNKIKSIEQELKEKWEDRKEPVKRRGHSFYDRYSETFVQGCRKTGCGDN